MNFKSLNFLLFFLLNVPFCLAFQEPIDAYTFNVSELDDLVFKGKQQAHQEDLDQAIITYQILQQKCWDSGLDSVAIDLYEDIFDLAFQKMEGIEYTLTFIDSCKQAEKDPSILGIYYAALAHNYLFHEEIDSMKKYYDLACPIYKTQGRFLQLTNFNIKIATEYYFFEQIPIAQKYLHIANQLEQTELFPRNIYTPLIYNIRTLIHYDKSEYEKAIQNSLATIQYDIKSGVASDQMIAYEYNNIAVALNTLGDNESALDYYKKALRIASSSGTKDPNNLVYLLNNIGSIYRSQEHKTRERDSYLKGLSLLLEADELNLDSKQDFINTYHSLAHYYRIQKQPDSALYYINQAAKLHQELTYRAMETNRLYSFYFLDQKDFKQAKNYAFKALDIALKKYHAPSHEVAFSYDLIASVFYTSKEYSTAIQYSQKALGSISSSFSD